jgi:hypothetical protein
MSRASKPESHTSAPAKPSGKCSLTDLEIQSLADTALAAWESGELRIVPASNGDRWEFEPVRDERMRLQMRRVKVGGIDPELETLEPDELIASGEMPQTEFGLDGTATILASRILALAAV